MNRPRKPSGSNPALIIGTLIAVAIVVGVIYQSQSTPSEDLELIATPEQEVEPVIQAPVVPEAVIPSAPEPEPEPQPSRNQHWYPSHQNFPAWITAMTLFASACC